MTREGGQWCEILVVSESFSLLHLCTCVLVHVSMCVMCMCLCVCLCAYTRAEVVLCHLFYLALENTWLFSSLTGSEAGGFVGSEGSSLVVLPAPPTEISGRHKNWCRDPITLNTGLSQNRLLDMQKNFINHNPDGATSTSH